MEIRNVDNRKLESREPVTPAEHRLDKMRTGLKTKLFNLVGLGKKEAPALKVYDPISDSGSHVKHDVIKPVDLLKFSTFSIYATKKQISILDNKGRELGTRVFDPSQKHSVGTTVTPGEDVARAFGRVHTLWECAKRPNEIGLESTIKIMLKKEEPNATAREILSYLNKIEEDLTANKRQAEEQEVLQRRSDSKNAVAEQSRRAAAEAKRTAGQHPSVLPKHIVRERAPRAQTPDQLGDGIEVIS